MTDLRRRVSMLAASGATIALLTNPLAASPAYDASMATVSEACQAANLDDVLKNPGRLT